MCAPLYPSHLSPISLWRVYCAWGGKGYKTSDSSDSAANLFQTLLSSRTKANSGALPLSCGECVLCLFVCFVFRATVKEKRRRKRRKKSFELLCFSLTHAALSFCLFETIYSYSREKGGGYEKKNVIRRRSLTTPPLTFVCFDFFVVFLFNFSSVKLKDRKTRIPIVCFS